jgi:hypothetical protein
MPIDSRKSNSTKKDGPAILRVSYHHFAYSFVEYLKKVKAKLEEAGKADRIPVFQKGATQLVKFILEKYDEVQIFTGESNDFDAGFAYCYYKEQTDAGPTFMFFADGMVEEKY